MLQYIQKKPLSPLQRQAAARQKEADRLEAWNDPKAVLVRKIRAATVAQHDAAVEAERVFHRENAPISAPKAAGAGIVHPQRAAALASFVAGWSDNPAEPIAPTMTREDHVRALSAQADAELQAANAAYAQYEAELRAETLGEEAILDDEDDDVPVLPVHRGRSRPRLSDEA